MLNRLEYILAETVRFGKIGYVIHSPMPGEVFNSWNIRTIRIIFIYILKYNFRKNCARTSSGVLHILMRIGSVAVAHQKLDFNF